MSEESVVSPGGTDFHTYDERTTNFADFKNELTAHDWAEKYRDRQFGPLFWPPIETISVVKTVGKGRTNLTVIRPTIVQADATTPYAGFDRREETAVQSPAVSVHFQPGAYGATLTAAYVMTFTIAVYGAATFALSAYASGGTVSGVGSRSLNGNVSVSLVFANIPPNAIVWGAIEQETGGQWSWYTTSISYPPILLTPIGTA
jgi:hypothetical protein